MIWKIDKSGQIGQYLDRIGLGAVLAETGSALLKINLARPPEVGHPRTDPELLSEIVRYVLANGSRCAIAEGADGYLRENLARIGLGWLLKEPGVEVIDLDLEDYDPVAIGAEEHYLPKCLKEYGVRIGIPVASKRAGMVFSNNVKLFVGAVPRKMYQLGEPVTWRPKIHIDLHKSVANIYQAFMAYAPFSFFINGGNAFDEKSGQFQFKEILIGNDGVELDAYILEKVFLIEKPEYIKRLQTRMPL